MITNCRQAIWQAIRKHLGRFAARDIYGALPSSALCTRGMVSEYLRGLTIAGYLTASGERHNRCYQLRRNIGHDAPSITRSGKPSTKGNVTEAIWRTMRILRGFSLVELRVTASTDDQPVSDASIRAYIRPLVSAGALVQTQDKPARYRLLPGYNSGPKPLQIDHLTRITDPNRDSRVIWLGKQQGEQP